MLTTRTNLFGSAGHNVGAAVSEGGQVAFSGTRPEGGVLEGGLRHLVAAAPECDHALIVEGLLHLVERSLDRVLLHHLQGLGVG